LVIAPESARSTSVENPTEYYSPAPGIAAKDFDQNGYLRDTIEEVRSVRTPEVLIPKFKEAVRRIRLGKGPVAITVSTDVLNGSMTIPDNLLDEVQAHTRIHTDSTSVLEPGAERIESVVDALLDSDATRNPLILVGRGAADEENREAIEKLAERMGAVLGTTFRGKGFFPEHPFYVGTIGETGERLAVEFATEADFVLSLGASLNGRTKDAGRIFRDEATVVQTDIDDSALGKYGPIDIGIHGDAKPAAELLHQELQEMDIDRSDSMWTENLQHRIETHDPYADVEFSTEPALIDPRQALSYLEDQLPTDRVVTVDGGHFHNWVYETIQVNSPDRMICRGDFSSIGLGLPMALGAAAGSREQVTPILFSGDGGTMMHLQELSTAARYSIPLLIFCLNDDALAAEYHHLPPEDQPIARTEAPNLADTAETLGCESYRVTDMDELRDISHVYQSRPSHPVFIECMIDREVQKI
jgi:thiamine pyrophosphate-dependent acetolactate synthase large subunit-like protein